MKILRLLLILFALSIILFQRVDVRVIRNERLTVKISFIFFAIVLIEDGRKRGYLKGTSRMLRNLGGLFHSLKFLFRKTDIVFPKADDNITKYDRKTPIIDVTLHFSLVRLIISSFILLYYIIKKKIKRVF